jgi:hypothetical protein
MSLGNLNFDDITEKDLNELIYAGVPEGLIIEYKRDNYGKSDADKKEALKDISSFANSFGGHLIIGINERNGIPIEIRALKDIDSDAEIQRLENLTRDGIEPRITGIKIRAIAIDSGGFVIIIRITKSWNPPHRVSARKENRFYVRNSSGVHEVSVEELRVLFNRSAAIHDRIQAFRRERLSAISADEGPIKIEHEGRLILHIVPFSAFGYSQLLDVKAIYDKSNLFRPISSSAMTPRFNFDGVINFRGAERCHGYTQIFRNGIIEATKAEIVKEREGQKSIPSLKFGKDIFEILPIYLDGLKSLDVPPPIVVMISLQEIYGAYLKVWRNAVDDESYQFNSSELLLPEIMIEDYGSSQNYQKIMRPAFDALWNAAGYAESNFFDENDIWIGADR